MDTSNKTETGRSDRQGGTETGPKPDTKKNNDHRQDTLGYNKQRNRHFAKVGLTIPGRKDREAAAVGAKNSNCTWESGDCGETARLQTWPVSALGLGRHTIGPFGFD